MIRHFFASLLCCGVAVMPIAHAEAETIALRHVRLIDGRGGAAVPNQTLIIADGRIAAVGPDDSVHVPASARSIDLTGRSIMPGLISDHSHLGYTDDTTSGPKNYNETNVVRELRQWQRYGVTTITSLGLNRPLFYQLQPRAHAGTLGGADFFGADRGIGMPGGAPPMDAAADQLYRPATVVEAIRDVDETAARHPSIVKLWVDDFHHSEPAKMSPEIYHAIIAEAHAKGLRVAAHVYYRDDARALVEAGADILAHGIRDQPVDAGLVALMKQRGTWYIPTLGLDESFYLYAQHPDWMDTAFFGDSVGPALALQFADPAWRAKATDPKSLAVNEASLATNSANLRTLYDAGVKIGFGTDSGATPLRIPGFAEHRELALMVKAGLTPLEAITIATHDAAQLLQLDDRGVIAPGKRADLLVIDGKPDEDIADVDHIDMVWQDGKPIAEAHS
ncbi:amidohydrolase family protein [Novosphingobium resinovorum]|uniref:amidohydrolase family protein n=1 Tax=Novosphingobium resinovorum TaxID=158500 RepID=UPI002ED644F6|nr:amidohydrolase family protein [Novosphingobium resinovorum]